MEPTQSPYVPEAGSKPGWRDLSWLVGYTARGLRELIRARRIFATLEAREIPDLNKAARTKTNPENPIPFGFVERVAYVLPRLSARLPWRSDCLIQAVAGQNWLRAYGLQSEIQIGVEIPEGGDFAAHAWLVHHDVVVTGGDIARYEVLLADSQNGTDTVPASRSRRPETPC